MTNLESAVNESVPQRMRVVRDSTFSRAVVDHVAVLDLGRELELSCLQYGGMLTQIDEMEDHYEMIADETITEVARIRIDYSEAVRLAMRIVERGIAANRVKGESVAASVAEWVVAAKTAKQKATD